MYYANLIQPIIRDSRGEQARGGTEGVPRRARGGMLAARLPGNEVNWTGVPVYHRIIVDCIVVDWIAP